MSFIQYAAIDFFPSILVVLGAPLLFPFVLAGLIIYHIIRKYVLKTLLKRWSLLDIFERASRNFFDKILYRSKKYPEQYVVSGYRAPRWYIYWLFSLLYGIITFSVALFWDNYFIKETTVCENSNKDQACFSMPQEYSDINWYAYPLTSCEAEANNSLLCFEFAFNLGKATGAAGGVFVAASLILTIITILILNCANNYETDGTTNVKHSRRIRRLLTASFQLTGVTITILVPVVIFYTPVFKTKVYENFGNSLKLVTAVYLIMFVWTTPWCWFVEEDIHKQRKHDVLSELEEGLAGSERKALIKKEKTVVEETKNVVVYGIEQPLSSAEKKTD